MRIALALLLLVSVARADECASIARSGDTDEKIAFIRARLRHEVVRAKAWDYAWTAAYSAISLGSLALSLGLKDRDDRINYAFTAGQAAVGLASVTILPPAVIRDQPRLERLAAADGDRCALLVEAERIFVRDAKSEAFSRGPLVHVANFVFNVGVGMGLILGFDHAGQGMLTTGSGVLVGEIMLATQPTRLVDDLRRYREGELRNDDKKIAWTLVPSVGSWGARFVVAF